MRALCLLLFALLLLACNADSTAQTGDSTVVGAVDRGGKLRESPDDRGRSVSALILRLGSAEAARGQRACLPIEASSFTDLIGFQYTIRFDSAALRYESVRNFKLPGYGPSNFGTRFTERGYLSTLWTENNLQGLSLPENSTLYEVCFTNLMPAGQETEVRFRDGPTKFEVIGSDMGQRKIRYANGVVRSRE